MSAGSMQNDWTQSAPMAILEKGYFKVLQGRFSPILHRTPACYGFTIMAKIEPGRAQAIRDYGKKIETIIANLPDGLAVLKLQYLRWMLVDVAKETYFMYQGIFDTDCDKCTEEAIALFSKCGLDTVFENLEGFPEDWRTNTRAFTRFVGEHKCPICLEYAEYPYASSGEIKKALKRKAAFCHMLDETQRFTRRFHVAAHQPDRREAMSTG